jgi:hypothetical protein
MLMESLSLERPSEIGTTQMSFIDIFHPPHDATEGVLGIWASSIVKF